ncbi:MAG: hypothetical protein IIA67_12180 [Planctomycetes bacterium]|nr:hypothetical protein [Planctomycetota bacterium]
MGRPSWFRRRLLTLGACYLLAVPSNTQVRDLQGDPPDDTGRGRQPHRQHTRVDKWTSVLDRRDWTVLGQS